MLTWWLPGCIFSATSSVLHDEFDLSMYSHISCRYLGVSTSAGVGRKGESRDNSIIVLGSVSAGRSRAYATDRRYSSFHW